MTATRTPNRPSLGGQAKRYEDWHGQIRALVERGVADGEFVCADPAGFTVRFAALSDGLALQRLRQAPRSARRTRVGTCTGWWRRSWRPADAEFSPPPEPRPGRSSG